MKVDNPGAASAANNVSHWSNPLDAGLLPVVKSIEFVIFLPVGPQTTYILYGKTKK